MHVMSIFPWTLSSRGTTANRTTPAAAATKVPKPSGRQTAPIAPCRLQGRSQNSNHLAPAFMATKGSSSAQANPTRYPPMGQIQHSQTAIPRLRMTNMPIEMTRGRLSQNCNSGHQARKASPEAAAMRQHTGRNCKRVHVFSQSLPSEASRMKRFGCATGHRCTCAADRPLLYNPCQELVLQVPPHPTVRRRRPPILVPLVERFFGAAPSCLCLCRHAPLYDGSSS